MTISSSPLIYNLPETENTAEVMREAAETLYWDDRGKLSRKLSDGDFNEAKDFFLDQAESQSEVLDYTVSPRRYVPTGIEGE